MRQDATKARLILYMAMSLDGFITGPDDDKENPAGIGGMRLMEWLGNAGRSTCSDTGADPLGR